MIPETLVSLSLHLPPPCCHSDRGRSLNCSGKSRGETKIETGNYSMSAKFLHPTDLHLLRVASASSSVFVALRSCLEKCLRGRAHFYKV